MKTRAIKLLAVFLDGNDLVLLEPDRWGLASACRWESRKSILGGQLKKKRILIGVLGLLSLSPHFGCQGPTLVTTVGSPSSEAVEGMVYYLPTGKITIKGDYPSAGDQRGGSGGQPNPKLTETGSPTSEIQPNQQLKEENDRVGGSSADIGAKATKTPEKPSGDNAATISGGSLALTVTASVEADRPAGIYYVTPKTNDIFDDEVQVTINAKHLLSAGKVTTEDKTAEILGTIASLAATAHGGLPLLAVTEKPQPFCFSFDPSNYDDVSFVRGQLKRHHIGLTLNVNGHNVIAEDIPVLPNDEVRQTAARLGQNGLVFRPAAVYTLRVVYPLDSENKEPKKGDPVFILDTEQFILPDRTKLCVMKFDRMPFVKKIREVGFTDGMLTDFHQKRPSPILGFLGIPKAIAQAVVPIPGAGSSGSGSASGTTGGH